MTPKAAELLGQTAPFLDLTEVWPGKEKPGPYPTGQKEQKKAENSDRKAPVLGKWFGSLSNGQTRY